MQIKRYYKRPKTRGATAQPRRDRCVCRGLSNMSRLADLVFLTFQHLKKLRKNFQLYTNKKIFVYFVFSLRGWQTPLATHFKWQTRIFLCYFNCFISVLSFCLIQITHLYTFLLHVAIIVNNFCNSES